MRVQRHVWHIKISKPLECQFDSNGLRYGSLYQFAGNAHESWNANEFGFSFVCCFKFVRVVSQSCEKDNLFCSVDPLQSTEVLFFTSHHAQQTFINMGRQQIVTTSQALGIKGWRSGWWERNAHSWNACWNCRDFGSDELWAKRDTCTKQSVNKRTVMLHLQLDGSQCLTLLPHDPPLPIWRLLKVVAWVSDWWETRTILLSLANAFKESPYWRLCED